VLVASATHSGFAAADEPTCDDGLRGCYRAVDGTLIDPSAEYDRRLDAADPFHLLSLGESAFWLGAGIAWYAADEERNLADWDFPSWEQRFTLEAWRFDNNHFPINFMGHSLSGAAYYAMPRANDHNIAVATTYGFVTSFIWEFFVEFREKVSVNDLIVTSGAGMTIGEFSHKLWRYFSGIAPDSSTGKQVLATVLGAPIYLRRAIDGTPQSGAAPYDDYGFSTHIGLRLGAGYQVRLHDYGKQVTTHGVWLGGRLSSIPGEGRPGDFALFFHEADIAELRLHGGIGQRARDLELITDTHILGLYGQDIDEGGNGIAGVVGWSLGFRYRFFDFDGYNDRLGILHLPGLGTDFSYRHGSTAVNAYWRLNGDFAGIHSAAHSRWAADAVGPDDRGKTVLRKHNYYYAWGVSSRFGGRLDLGPVDLGVGVSIGAYDSQEGLDRSQEELTLDPDATDRAIELETQVGLTVPSTPMRIGVGWASSERRSRVGHQTVDRHLQTWSLAVGAHL